MAPRSTTDKKCTNKKVNAQTDRRSNIEKAKTLKKTIKPSKTKHIPKVEKLKALLKDTEVVRHRNPHTRYAELKILKVAISIAENPNTNKYGKMDVHECIRRAVCEGNRLRLKKMVDGRTPEVASIENARYVGVKRACINLMNLCDTEN